jgi:tetratricopeptide (TPR) repeat protein
MPPKIGAVRNQLSTSSDWSLVYYDDYYLVFLKKNDRNRALLGQYAFQMVSPLKSGFGFTPRGDSERFFEESLRGLDNNRSSSLAHAIHAYALQNRGEFLSAASAYKNALEIQPERTEMYRSVANMYLQAAVYDSAIAWYRTILEKNPRDAQTLFEIGFLYARINELEQAERYLRESLAQNPNSPARALLERLNALKAQSRGDSEQK